MSLVSDLQDKPRFLTQQETAELLRVAQSTISQWIEDKKLGCYRLFGKQNLCRIDSGELADLLLSYYTGHRPREPSGKLYSR
jgi:excisionase family DNA binding protein